jgi:hypothetical protein
MSAKFSIFSLAATAVLLSASLSATAADSSNASFSSESDNTPSSGAIAADIIVLRPIGFVGMVLGTAIFVAGLPFEALAGDVSGPAKRLVAEPAKFTFARQLGQTGDTH